LYVIGRSKTVQSQDAADIAGNEIVATGIPREMPVDVNRQWSAPQYEEYQRLRGEGGLLYRGAKGVPQSTSSKSIMEARKNIETTLRANIELLGSAADVKRHDEIMDNIERSLTSLESLLPLAQQLALKGDTWGRLAENNIKQDLVQYEQYRKAGFR